MPELSLGDDPMLKHKSSSTFDEERRLLGGKDKRPDPGAVLIFPGQTAKKKVIASPFRPHDGISRGSRESGPVRARGKEKKYYTSQARSNNTVDNSERSAKRRRVESPEEMPKQIGISDDDRLGQGSPAATRSITAQSPTPSQLSNQLKRPGLSTGQLSEYRNVDKSTRVPRASSQKRSSFSHRFSSEDVDLSFIHDAAKERRGKPAFKDGEPAQVSRKLPEQTSNISVEILSKPPTLTSHEPRSSIARESPDELQGDVTVRPVPRSLDNLKSGTIAVPSKQSSSDIQPTIFITKDKSKQGVRKTKKGQKAAMKPPPPAPFILKYFRWGPILHKVLGGENDHISVRPSQREIYFTLGDVAYEESISLDKLLKVYVGQALSCKCRFFLSKVQGKDTTIDFELLSTEERKRLESVVKSLEKTIQGKEGSDMEKIFRKSEREHNKYALTPNGIKRPLVLVDAPKEPAQPLHRTTKRMKLSDGLQSIDRNTTQLSSDTALDKPANPSLPTTTLSDISFPERPSTPPSDQQRSRAVEIPVKKYSPSLQASSRATRSMSRKTPTALVCDDDDENDDGNHDEVNTPHHIFDMDEKWNNKPLVYPKFGKKKAEVSAVDLERLAPHQFLNDNIIGLYIRFLEDHLQRCNAEAAKRVYFFNSYFFATLTNSPRGKRSINYEGVAKWTRNVDLFSYDHIVVPINEDAHWYLAIICNLPHLEGVLEEANPPGSQAPSEVQEVPETPENIQEGEEEISSSQALKEDIARRSLASMSLVEPQQEGSRSGEEDWPEREELPAISRAKFSEHSSQLQPECSKEFETKEMPKKARKLKRKPSSGQRFDFNQPIIITFDSLNMGRSPTISTLREYLFAEAKAKRGIEIDKAIIKGMTAKEIPQQPNFSDCGLYLLAYVEKFVQDPDLFCRKLLRRDMRVKEDWPPLRSGSLRSRLRKFMELLYIEQEQLTNVNADEKTLMVDQRPISYLLGSPTEDRVDDKDKDEADKPPQLQVERSPPPVNSKSSRRSREPSAQPNCAKPEFDKKQLPENSETRDSVNPIVQPPSPLVKPLKQDAQKQSPKEEVIEVPDSQGQPGASTATAQSTGSRVLRPPAPKANPTNAVYVEGGDYLEDYLPQSSENGGRRVEVRVQVNETPPPESPNSK
ncbi:hypothetical protein BJX70DRAFT_398987 [Aspergillus crustosus]